MSETQTIKLPHTTVHLTQNLKDGLKLDSRLSKCVLQIPHVCHTDSEFIFTPLILSQVSDDMIDISDLDWGEDDTIVIPLLSNRKLFNEPYKTPLEDAVNRVLTEPWVKLLRQKVSGRLALETVLIIALSSVDIEELYSAACIALADKNKALKRLRSDLPCLLKIKSDILRLVGEFSVYHVVSMINDTNSDFLGAQLPTPGTGYGSDICVFHFDEKGAPEKFRVRNMPREISLREVLLARDKWYLYKVEGKVTLTVNRFNLIHSNPKVNIKSEGIKFNILRDEKQQRTKIEVGNLITPDSGMIKTSILDWFVVTGFKDGLYAVREWDNIELGKGSFHSCGEDVTYFTEEQLLRTFTVTNIIDDYVSIRYQQGLSL